MDVEYTYAAGDLLDNPHTYQYSQFCGVLFVEAWLKHRSEVIKEIGISSHPPGPNDVADCNCSDLIKLAHLLEDVYGELQEKENFIEASCAGTVKTLIKKFELTKRLYCSYDNNFKPTDRGDYRNLNNYLRFAEVMELYYKNTHDIPTLNVFLKIIDTLIASKEMLDELQRARLAWLIEREQEYVIGRLRRCGVVL